jgi:1,4-alpha-glucan branching enzyme
MGDMQKSPSAPLHIQEAPQPTNWRLPFGAEVQSEGVSFRVWASKRKHVDVILLGVSMA